MLLSWVSKYDGRGTAAARKDFAKLGKTAVSTQLTVAGLTYAFGRLARASIQAAMAEQQSLTQVNKALENAGFRNATTQVDEFIVSLQNATGIVKKELRPAFLTLFNATGDVGASQEALRKALDIVAGTGKDLSTVVTALSRAYSGNRESLNELNTGLDKTLLKTGSLVEIMAELDRKFRGQAAAASATLTAQFLQLQLGIDKVTQAFGKGFIEELRISEIDVAKFADAMYNLGQFLGMVTNKVTNLTGSLTDLKSWFVSFARNTLGWSKWLQKSVVDPIGTLKDSVSSMPAVAGGGSALEAYLKRVQKMQDEAAAKADAAYRRDLAQKKRQAAMDKAIAEKAITYDTERVALQAALSKTTDATTRKRLTDLLTINTATYAEDLQLTKIKDILTLINEEMKKYTQATDDTGKGIGAWVTSLTNVETALKSATVAASGLKGEFAAAGVASNSISLPARGLVPAGGLGPTIPDAYIPPVAATAAAAAVDAIKQTLPAVTAAVMQELPVGNVSPEVLPAAGPSFIDRQVSSQIAEALPVVNVVVQGSVIAETDLATAVGEAVNRYTRSGGRLSPVAV